MEWITKVRARLRDPPAPFPDSGLLDSIMTPDLVLAAADDYAIQPIARKFSYIFLFNPSANLYLKAEIARRQVEVKNKSTLLPEGCTVIKASTAGNGTAIKSIFRKPPKAVPPDTTAADADEEASQDRAELERLERSRRTLEAKAKLYEALKSAALGGARTSSGDAEDDSAPLVDFERMAMERKAQENDYISSDDDHDDDDDESREQDSDRHDHRRDRRPLAEPVSIPDGPITYAHLRKGEVRDHGVGFYAFSADMEQRASEMASLNELHRSTQQARQRAEAARAKRDIQMSQRLAKLRARKGLPDVATAVAQCLGETPDVAAERADDAQPEDEKVQSAPPPSTCDLALGSDDLDIASMLRRLRDEAEQRAEEQTAAATATPVEESPTLPPPPQPPAAFRKRAREWDRGKSMVPAKVFIQREQQEKRNYQFAPPPSYY
ncbi:hypothetical protein SprV_0802567200 [Sparganum proliferum]